jgi:hypothetical protein
MKREKTQRVLTALGLGAMLMANVALPGAAEAAPQAQVKPYTGQVKEIKIDQCGSQPGTCEGSMVLEQPRGQRVALAILPGTPIQRGEQHVYLDEVGVGNYVTVYAALLPRAVRQGGRTMVGTDPGERPLRLDETDEE